MENPTSFDLNRAIQQWREHPAQSPTSRSGNLADLESRLRDSIVEARACGLSLEESFLVAVKRVGSGSPETDRNGGDARGPWAHRIMWLLLGFQCWIILTVTYHVSVVSVWRMSGRLGQMYDGKGDIAFGLTAAFLSVLLLAVVGYGCWKLFLKSNGVMRGVVESLSGRPMRLALGISLTTFCAILLADSFHWFCVQEVYGALAGKWWGHLLGGSSSYFLLSCAACLVLNLLLTRQLRRLTRSAVIPSAFDLKGAICRWREHLAQSPAFHKENLDELDSHLRDSIGELQARGLSEEESFVITARRMGRNELLEREFAKVNGDSVWLDRILWLLLGFQVWMILASIHGAAATLVQTTAGSLVQWWPGFNELAYLGLIRVLPFLLLVGLVAIGWSRISNAEQQVRNWLTGLMRRPRRLAILLFAVSACSSWLASVFQVYGVPLLFSMNITHFSWQFAFLSPLASLPQYAACAALTAFFARRLLRATAA